MYLFIFIIENEMFYIAKINDTYLYNVVESHILERYFLSSRFLGKE